MTTQEENLISQEQEKIGAIMREQFLVASPEFTLIIGKYFAGLSGELNNIAADLRTGSKEKIIKRLEQLADGSKSIAHEIVLACLAGKQTTGEDLH